MEVSERPSARYQISVGVLVVLILTAEIIAYAFGGIPSAASLRTA